MRLWRLFTSVNFAVVQIVAVAVLAVFGMTIRQLPGFAFRSAADYATEMNRLRSIYEPVLGVGTVDLFERLQLFHVFNSTPFSIALLVLVISILVCTLDRTPRLWQQSAAIRVVQPDAYFDPAGQNLLKAEAPFDMIPQRKRSGRSITRRHFRNNPFWFRSYRRITRKLRRSPSNWQISPIKSGRV